MNTGIGKRIGRSNTKCVFFAWHCMFETYNQLPESKVDKLTHIFGKGQRVGLCGYIANPVGNLARLLNLGNLCLSPGEGRTPKNMFNHL